ncbi:hypothetical protein JY651_28775 [Pyxidicoccus parkwayensis]|uniref:Uncharacterized protein n=1 Tax=Pyxidicoccus parkwayensis TaxID=2813578 RepID=A0ABX7NP92_9BACT|nr:hypothetical protein [Pyxidicoccus parkwaysis]QSQ19327.1 hypothetical protein JY651_28775 [Pyxidicoccus parkwaysis]
MVLFGVVRATGLSPDEVRAWAWPDTLHYLAYCELEAERARLPSSRGTSPRSGANTRTLIYRVHPRPGE